MTLDVQDEEECEEDEYVPLSKKHRSSSGNSRKGGSSSSGRSKKRRKTPKDRLFGDDNLYNPFHTGDDHESDEDYAPSR